MFSHPVSMPGLTEAFFVEWVELQKLTYNLWMMCVLSSNINTTSLHFRCCSSEWPLYPCCLEQMKYSAWFFLSLRVKICLHVWTHFQVGASVPHSGTSHSNGTWTRAPIARLSPPTAAWGCVHLAVWEIRTSQGTDGAEMLDKCVLKSRIKATLIKRLDYDL